MPCFTPKGVAKAPHLYPVRLHLPAMGRRQEYPVEQLYFPNIQRFNRLHFPVPGGGGGPAGYEGTADVRRLPPTGQFFPAAASLFNTS